LFRVSANGDDGRRRIEKSKGELDIGYVEARQAQGLREEPAYRSDFSRCTP
jgi:hypothetical protein